MAHLKGLLDAPDAGLQDSTQIIRLHPSLRHLSRSLCRCVFRKEEGGAWTY